VVEIGGVRVLFDEEEVVAGFRDPEEDEPFEEAAGGDGLLGIC
jgi:hypothetical protein